MASAEASSSVHVSETSLLSRDQEGSEGQPKQASDPGSEEQKESHGDSPITERKSRNFEFTEQQTLGRIDGISGL